MWSDKTLPFDGSPYLVLGKKVLDCQHGKDRKEARKRKMKMEKEVVVILKIFCSVDDSIG